MMDVTDTRDPPTFRTMSAKTVVIVTTSSVAPDGSPLPAAGPAEPEPGPQATVRGATRSAVAARTWTAVAVRAMTLRLSLTTSRTGFSTVSLVGWAPADQASGVVLAWQCRQSPKGASRWLSIR